MAKNRNKKRGDDGGMKSMDVSEPTVSNQPQAMHTYEGMGLQPNSGAPKPSTYVSMKTKKGRPIKRSMNVRKNQAIAKAIAKTEKKVEKVLKKQNKVSRTQSAKLLYE